VESLYFFFSKCVVFEEGGGGLILLPPRAVPAISLYENLSHGLEEE
jgi:hypothetical protein